jgi:hypothetical protein
VREVCAGGEDILLSEYDEGVKVRLMTVRRVGREASASRVAK